MIQPTQPTVQIISKPPTRELLQSYLDNELPEEALRLIRKWKLDLKIENNKLIETGNSTDAWLDRFITNDKAMLLMKERVRRMALVTDEVLISGETGTGKELIALALHGDKDAKIVSENCAGWPEHLIESELFGHKKGAFTGADTDNKGLMLEAGSGTLFLDEIGELQLSVQAKLLRALQSRRIRAVGSTDYKNIMCRIVCATNRNLHEMYLAGEFRKDLYARISTLKIELSPLSERTEDIELIIASLKDGPEFLKAWHEKKEELEQGDTPRTLLLEAPLNVRSLQQYVRRWKVLGELPI